MNLTNLVYSTDTKSQTDIVPRIYHKRANAPEVGDVFTAQAIRKEDAKDLVVSGIQNHTGYLKTNFEDPKKVSHGEYWRVKIVAGPYNKNHHNFFYVIPVRKIQEDETLGLNKVDPQTSMFIQRLGEFMMGLGWNRKQKKYYPLSKRQDWNWFCKTFEV